MELGIDIIFKIAAIGIITSVVNIILNKAGKDELGMMVSLVGIIIVVMLVVDKISYLFDSIKVLFDL